MPLRRLDIHDLRNIAEAHLEPHPRLNVVAGPNGSGKSSLLEAIYLLGRGRSFRSTRKGRLIREGADRSILFAKTEHPDHSVGLQITDRNLKGKIDGSVIHKTSLLAAAIPLLFISPDADRLIQGTPKQRRRFLDWGLFHVEHDYLGHWKRYNRSLTQRNALLKRGRRGELEGWNLQLAAHGEVIDACRRRYAEALQRHFEHHLERLSDGELRLRLEYRKGWSGTSTLAEALEEGSETDLVQGTTQRGPHRADLVVCREEGGAALDFLSGGQQKLAACALILAQASVLDEERGRRTTLLVDDLPAELDTIHRQRLMELLAAVGGQLFVTATDPSLLPLEHFSDHALFHVEHGHISG